VPGALSENKNLASLVRWFAAAQRREPSLHLYIAGRAEAGKPGQLDALVRALDAGAAIDIVADPSDAAICRLIEQSRFVISASTYEGFGLTVPELMAYGLVPVLSDIPAFRHFIEQARIGALFDFDESSFAAALRNAVAAFAPAQIERAERFASRYSWDTVAQQFAAVYDA
jgi:alpha-1,3-mannosyltransferase